MLTSRYGSMANMENQCQTVLLTQPIKLVAECSLIQSDYHNNRHMLKPVLRRLKGQGALNEAKIIAKM